ncbi:MAG TPA: prephenate dehydrogenase/arogenate dehydrogenase family protein [Gammaproteobacteria bacterium]|nr:prephenate dehydrogenase/arogenate dehydrogenase family protein [Gammaproteobacteria bacterium]
MFIQRLTIIGVGLIGGSLARALKRAGACGEIVGCGRNTANLQHAIELGVIDRYDTNPAVAVKDADRVVVAVPLGAMADLFAVIRDALSPQAIITDVGSAKGTVVADAREHLGQHLSRFVPGHPIAGTEKSGVAASFAELFENHRVILTPLPETDSTAHAKIKTMWQLTKAEVIDMSVEHHDEVLAATSHLPHLLAYSLVDTLAKMEERSEIFQYAAGGFRDFTRIASSDPRMWHDITLANREAILKVLDRFNTNLAELADAIRQGESQEIENTFSRAKAARDKLSTL